MLCVPRGAKGWKFRAEWLLQDNVIPFKIISLAAPHIVRRKSPMIGPDAGMSVGFGLMGFGLDPRCKRHCSTPAINKVASINVYICFNLFNRESQQRPIGLSIKNELAKTAADKARTSVNQSFHKSYSRNHG